MNCQISDFHLSVKSSRLSQCLTCKCLVVGVCQHLLEIKRRIMENLEKMVFFGSANVKENKVVKNLLSISIWVYLRFFQGAVLVLQLGALSGIRVCSKLCVVRSVNYWMRRCSCLFKHILSVWSDAWNEDWAPLPWNGCSNETAPQSFHSMMRLWEGRELLLELHYSWLGDFLGFTQRLFLGSLGFGGSMGCALQQFYALWVTP